MAQIAQMVGQAGQTVLTSYGLKEQGKADRRHAEQVMAADEFQAQMLEERAGAEIATAQRQRFEESRTAGLVASRALAVAAASGGGASDTTVGNLIARVKGEGAYRGMVRMYEGESRARTLRLGATAKRYEGALGVQEAAAGQRIGNNMAFANLLIGSGGLYGKYGGGSSGGGTGIGTGMEPGIGMGDTAGSGGMSPW